MRDLTDRVSMSERFAYFNNREPSPEELEDYISDTLAEKIDAAMDRWKDGSIT